jgi:hypothetical protein
MGHKDAIRLDTSIDRLIMFKPMQSLWVLTNYQKAGRRRGRIYHEAMRDVVFVHELQSLESEIEER